MSTPSDDELRDALRAEVPEPGPDYWDNIDARLQGVVAERLLADAEKSPTGQSRDTRTTLSRPTGMNNQPDTPTAPYRPFLLVAAAVALVAVGVFALINVRDTTSTVDFADDATPSEEVEDPGGDASEAVDAPTEPTSPEATEVPILVPDGFDIATPVTPLEPFEFESVGPDLTGTLCESGIEARTPDIFPQPVEEAVAVDPATQIMVRYTRFELEPPQDADSILNLWGEGGCEATFETVQEDNGTIAIGDTILIPDQPIDIDVPEGYRAEAIRLDTPGSPVGILVVGAGQEVVLAVVVDPPVDEIPRILQSAADAYIGSVE